MDSMTGSDMLEEMDGKKRAWPWVAGGVIGLAGAAIFFLGGTVTPQNLAQNPNLPPPGAGQPAEPGQPGVPEAPGGEAPGASPKAPEPQLPPVDLPGDEPAPGAEPPGAEEPPAEPSEEPSAEAPPAPAAS